MSNHTITKTPANSDITYLCSNCQQKHKSSIGPKSRVIKIFSFHLGKKTASQIPKNPKSKLTVDQNHNKIGIFLKNKFHKKENLDLLERQSIPSHERRKKTICSSFNKISEFTDWLKNNSDIPNSLDSDQAKGLSLLEKKDPEELKSTIVEQITHSYQTDNAGKADNQLKLIRPRLSYSFMAKVDESIIDILKSDENSTAAELYQNKQINNQSIHYKDLLMLDNLVQDIQAGRSLDRAGQETLLSQIKGKLETIDPKNFTPKQHELLKNAKERVANLERALPLVDKSTVNRSDVLKTLAASGGLAVCLTAIGTLIALLVKIGHSKATDETDTVDDAISDQTDAIEAKKNELDTQKNNIETLKSQEKELLDQGANLSEDDIRATTEAAATNQAIQDGYFVHDLKPEGGIANLQPDDTGKAVIQEQVDKAIAKHRDNQALLNHTQEDLRTAQSEIDALQGELDDLNLKQGNYEGQQAINSSPKSMQSSNTKTEARILSSIGLGGFSLLGGVSGLFALNHSKVVPKYKLSRSNQQAVQSLNKIIASNQPGIEGMPPVNTMPLKRINTL
jgi:hypothetical protein